ncbi:carboxypeptidase-like regulatory domain-containing protein [Pyxidicoccus trucidator]|uniref:carboxypeptidase-like regulatory domain-containing protein n=1 Tax=Pyxidicoccus trucidator TaxID=2709662 RepID=UPI0013DC1B5B|nr:carboxypeptidase-like regulatory domain-containing protein [Pyxidicoccus trucidator]
MLRTVLPCVLLLLSSSAWGYDGHGVLMGTTLGLEGETGQPLKVLPGVTVSVTSPRLMGERIVESDENGFYRLAQLPPGVYRVIYEREGYNPIFIHDVVVRLNHTLRMNMGLVLHEDARCGFYGSYYLSAPSGW